jgi:hypothetical protein
VEHFAARRLLASIVVVSTVAFATAVVAGPQAANKTGAACTAHWRLVAHANVPPLNSVVALSANDVWAVGGHQGGDSTREVYEPVILHWDGRTLRRFKAFVPSNSHDGGELTAVAAVSPTDVWAVGHDGETPIVMHWDGNTWSIVSTPAPRTGRLTDIVTVPNGDVWVIGATNSGSPIVMQRSGERWRTHDVRAGLEKGRTYLRAIDATSSSDVWVSATWNNGINSHGDHPVVTHWNGRSWTRTTFEPQHSGLFAMDLDAGAPREVWTLDVANDSGEWGPWGYRLVHWNGETVREHPYSTPSVFPLALAAVSSNNVWVVGVVEGDSYNSPAKPLVIHWNRKPARAHPMFESLKDTTLASLSVVSPTEIWAAGKHLIARYSC